jgi:hypothetical protein
MRRRDRKSQLGINWMHYAAEDVWKGVKGAPAIKLASEHLEGRGGGEAVFHAVVNGKVVGEVTIFATSDGKTATIESIAVGPKKLGLGTKLYEAAAQWSCSRLRKPLASDEQRSAAADSFWKKQARKKRATCAWRLTGEEAKNAREDEKWTQPGVSLWARGACVRYVLRCPAPKSLAGARRRR